MLRKLQSLSRRVREEGISATGSFVATRFIGLLRYSSPLPPNTIEANLEQWSRHDWSAHGEEWTPSQEWKMSLVKHVLEPNIPVGSHVLEIGPGGGRWTEFLVQRAARLIAVDLTPRCIELCRERFKGHQNISFFVNDGTDLSFIPVGSLDRIWSFDVFVHIHPQDIENYVRQLSQVLAGGGRGVIHHAARGILKEGWRSDMTAQNMIEFCTKYGLVIVRQFTSWDEDHFHISPHCPDNSADVITVFEKPLRHLG